MDHVRGAVLSEERRRRGLVAEVCVLAGEKNVLVALPARRGR